MAKQYVKISVIETEEEDFGWTTEELLAPKVQLKKSSSNIFKFLIESLLPFNQNKKSNSLFKKKQSGHIFQHKN
ncbi:MAG: hypothetical protein QM802_22290 [Agriterribacter sp.]